MSFQEIEEFKEETNEKINELRNEIKKNKEGEAKWKFITNAITIAMFTISTGVNIYFHIQDSKSDEKKAIASLLNQQALLQKQIDNVNRSSEIQNNIQRLNEVLKEKVQTRNEINNAFFEFSVYLCRHEKYCQIKDKNEFERQYDKFDIIKYVQDIDGKLGEEVDDILKDFIKKFQKTYRYSKQKKRYRITSDEVRIMNLKMTALINKNIQKTKDDIEKENKFLSKTDSSLKIVNSATNDNIIHHIN